MERYTPDQNLLYLVGLGDTESFDIFLVDRLSILSNGRTWPNGIAKLRYFYNSEICQAEGCVVIIEKRKRGRRRSNNEIRETLVHELIHVSQYYRNRRIIIIGILVNYGLALGIGLLVMIVYQEKWMSLFAMLIGYQIGYMLSPNELEARKITKKLLSVETTN